MGLQISLNPTKVQELSEIVTSNDFVKNQLEGYAGKKVAIARTTKQLKAIISLCKQGIAELKSVKDNVKFTKV